MVADDEFILLISVTGLVGIFTFYSWTRKNKDGKKMAPRLPAVPLLGSLPWMLDFNPAKFTELAKKYGSVYGFYLGSKYNVVLNTREAINEALVSKSAHFAQRPRYSAHKHTNPDMRGFTSGNYGEAFIKRKQISMNILCQFGFGKNSMEDRILDDVRELLRRFTQQGAVPFDPKEVALISIANITSSIIFSKRFPYEKSPLVSLMEEFDGMVACLTSLMILDLFPVCRHLPAVKKQIDAVKTHMTRINEFVQREVEEHAKRDDLHPADEADDFISAYKRRMGEKFDEEELYYIVKDLFSAGSEPTAITLLWSFVYLVNNPRAQAEVQAEIDAVVGEERLPSLGDRRRMPLAEATLQETMRLSNVAPISFPRRSTADTHIDGFFIPEDTTVFTNVALVHHDPRVWDEPGVFNPRRFLDDNGSLVNQNKLITFGLGRRACIGESLARQELFLFFTSILQQFSIHPPDGVEKLNQVGKPEFLIKPAAFKIKLVPRGNAALLSEA